MWPISVKRWEPVSGSAPEGSSYRESIAHKTVPPGVEDYAAENLDDAFMIQAGKWRLTKWTLEMSQPANKGLCNNYLEWGEMGEICPKTKSYPPFSLSKN